MENESILATVKTQLGILDDYDVFDTELIIHINAVLRILNQIGIGKLGFNITGDSETWEDFIGDKLSVLSEVKTYVYLKVRTIWDPPTSGSHATAIENMMKELEWRLNIQIDPSDYDWTNEEFDADG